MVYYKMTKKIRFSLFIFISLSLITSIRSQHMLPEREIHYRPGDWISYPVTRFITSITLDHQYTYFGTTGGISRYDFYSSRWEPPFTFSDGLEDDNIRVVAYDFSTGYLWCATGYGLSYRVPGSDQWFNIPDSDLDLPLITSIGFGNKFMWLESSGVLFKGERLNDQYENSNEDDADKDNVQWYGVKGKPDGPLQSLFMDTNYFFFPEGYIQDMELRRYDIITRYRDAFDNLWMGIWGLGAGLANMKTLNLDIIPFGLYISEIYAMAWDDEGMWIGGNPLEREEGGITWWNMDNNEWSYFEAKFIPSLRTDRITCIETDDKHVWLGTQDGLAVFHKEENLWRTYGVHDNLWDNRITCLALGDDELWVGTVYGLNRIAIPGMVIEAIRDKRLIHQSINQIEADGRDLWIGTDTGILQYQGESNQIAYFEGYSGMVVMPVMAISVWDNEVWFGTEDGVAGYQKSKEKWWGFPKFLYSIGDDIHVILADETAIWVGTDNGVWKYLKEEDRWRQFTKADGLLDNTVRWMLLDGDYIWFGTGRGLTRFYWNAPHRID